MTKFILSYCGEISLCREVKEESFTAKEFFSGTSIATWSYDEWHPRESTGCSIEMQPDGRVNVYSLDATRPRDLDLTFRGPMAYLQKNGDSETIELFLEEVPAYRLVKIADENAFLAKVGELEDFFPGLVQLGGCGQPPALHVEGDALTHTAKVFGETKKIVTPEWSEREELLLLAAAVCHDIEKPGTRIESDGKITFYKHADLAR